MSETRLVLCPDCQVIYNGGECLGCRFQKTQAENRRLKAAGDYLRKEQEKIRLGADIPYEYFDGYTVALTDYEQVLKGE